MSLSKPMRFRKAVLGLTAIDTYARELTVDDVANKWSHLSASGYSPIHLVNIGNSDDIDDELFKTLMKCLNSYL